MAFQLIEILSEQEVCGSFAAIQALRPHLSLDQALPQIARQRLQGYRMLGLRDESIAELAKPEAIPSFIGFRVAEFLAWGKIIYIDDLSTIDSQRGQGHAGILLDHVIAIAREQACSAVHLDSGYARNAAHRLYLNKGFILSSHHFALQL
ncbi:MAG: GNAT family N-acetyltransferase [Burkholderiaceae bacterium]|nr:MAG: GNAT family N-acetyltransferase [Burkholderiaceae bacterium]